MQWKVDEIKRNIRQIYPDNPDSIRYNMSWLSHILINHEYRDTISGYEAFNTLVHLSIRRTMTNPYSQIGALDLEQREAIKILCLIPNLPFFLDRLIDNIAEAYRPKVIAKYSWLIEEVERVKPTLTPAEIKPFTYKPWNTPVESGWARGSLSSSERTWFTNAIKNGTQLDFNIEFNPIYPDTLNRESGILCNNSYYTKYQYITSGRTYDWYEIRDPYLTWYNKFDPNGRRNSITAFFLCKIVEDRLNNGFNSINNNNIDGRLLTWFADAINFGIEKRGLPVTVLRRHPAIMLSQDTITILKNWLA